MGDGGWGPASVLCRQRWSWEGCLAEGSLSKTGRTGLAYVPLKQVGEGRVGRAGPGEGVGRGGGGERGWHRCPPVHGRVGMGCQGRVDLGAPGGERGLAAWYREAVQVSGRA